MLRQLPAVFEASRRALEKWLVDAHHSGPMAEWTRAAQCWKDTVTGYVRRHPQFGPRGRGKAFFATTMERTVKRIADAVDKLILLQQGRENNFETRIEVRVKIERQNAKRCSPFRRMKMSKN